MSVDVTTTPTSTHNTPPIDVEGVMNIEDLNHVTLLQRPEDFLVEGEERMEIQPPVNAQPNYTKARNKTVYTIKETKGNHTIQKKTNKYNVPPRKEKEMPRCQAAYCQVRNLECQSFKNTDQASIRQAFYELGDLSLQRQWIARHIEFSNNEKPTTKVNIKYFLPQCTDTTSKLQVCKIMFLNTVGISERQVRTVIKKTKLFGMLETEKRGGRKRQDKEQALANEVRKHINRFPKMESRFCRANTGYQYLSPDLCINKMYIMYIRTRCKGRNGKLS